jgi:hypothetical protein
VILKNGANTISIQVTSANGKHIRSIAVKIYVYTKQSLKSTVGFSKSVAKITSKGTSSLNSAISKLKSSQKLVVNLSMAKSKNLSTAKNNILLKQRHDLIVKLLKAKGIKTLKVTRALTSSGSTDSVTFSASYVK